MNFIYNNILFIFSTITYKMAQISDPYTTGHLLVHSRFATELLWYQNTPQNPKTSVLGLKPNPNLAPDWPKTIPKILSGLSENSPKIQPELSENSLEIQLRLFENSPKNSYTQPQKFGTEIYGLSRSLSKS